MRTLVMLVLWCVVSPKLSAQQPDRPSPANSTIVGRVVSSTGEPLAGASARLLATADSALTDSRGSFALRTGQVGAGRIVIRKLAFLPETVSVVLPAEGELLVRLRPSPRALEAVRVVAGTYRTGYDRQATLTPIQVVNVPGAAGDIGRAIQSLPGVQAVDEGNGVYVRGGEVGETRVVLNDAAMLIAPRMESPSGTAAPTVNPFLLEGISFSAGSFSVRRGNALSGLIELRSQGRPTAVQASANVALNVVAATVATPLGTSAGLRLNASRSDAGLALRLNGTTRQYAPVPNGSDLTGSLVWAPRKSGELKVFAVQQRAGFGVGAGDPAILSSSAGAYASGQQNRFASLSWRDVLGRVAATTSVALSRFERDERAGSYHADATLDGVSAFSELVVAVTQQVTARVGGDAETAKAGLDEQVLRWRANGTSTGELVSRERVVSIPRQGAFVEGQWQMGPPVRISAGLRTDHDGGSDIRTYDPRVDLGLRLTSSLSATAAWGIYHQAVAPTMALRVENGAAPQPARARQQSLGLQWEHGNQVLRGEVYSKAYENLTGLDRSFRAVAGGRGRASGIDVFAKTQPAAALSVRGVYSFVNSRRTDPESGTMARSPADVTHSLLLVGETAWHRNEWRAGAAYRAATGRPLTPILGGTRNVAGTFDPVYGAPMSDRLPAFARVDLSLSTVRALTPAVQLVAYSSLSNALDKANVFAYRYSADFGERIQVRSAFKRAVYLGASLSYTRSR